MNTDIVTVCAVFLILSSIWGWITRPSKTEGPELVRLATKMEKRGSDSLSEEEQAKVVRGCSKAAGIYLVAILAFIAEVLLIVGALTLHIGIPALAYLTIIVWLGAGILTHPLIMQEYQRQQNAAAKGLRLEEPVTLPLKYQIVSNLPLLYTVYILLILAGVLPNSVAF